MVKRGQAKKHAAAKPSASRKSSSKLPLLVYGSREYAKVVRALLESCGRKFAGFIDDFAQSKESVGTFSEVCKTHPNNRFEVVLGIGYNDLKGRLSALDRVLVAGYRLPVLIHPSAVVHESATLGQGSLVMAGAVIDVGCSIGDGSVVWPSVSVNHDSRVGRNVFLSPGAILCGFSSVGSSVFVGAGAIVVDHRSVPDETFVKAGARYV